jgi:hypothetical protein
MEERTMRRLVCPLNRPVSVTDYTRFRRGRLEYVRSHCRGMPKR